MLTRRKAILKFEKYLEQINQSKTYLNYIKILFKFLNQNNLTLSTLSKEQLLIFLQGYSINTKNLFLKAIKSYCSCFEIKTPLLEIKTIRPNVKIKEYPTDIELKNNVLPKLTDKERAIIDFLVATGLRKNEFLTLLRNQIDIEKRIAKVNGKGRKERIVVFPQSVADEVKALFDKEPEKENSFNITSAKLRGMCKKITQELQVKVTPHSLRHIFALSVYKKGLDLVSISRLLGHTSISTTQIYLNQTDEEVQKNYNAVME